METTSDVFFILSLMFLLGANGQVFKRACLGDSITLVNNIEYNRSDSVVSIYKTIDIPYMLGIWRITNGNAAKQGGQGERLVFDKKGNIWILNVIVTDEAHYTIKVNLGPLETSYNISLEVMVPPTKNCKPNIIRAGNNLFAEVNNTECGRPIASAYWLQHIGKYVSRHIIQLHPGNENNIYHACIEGSSMLCAESTNVMEHCTIYNTSTYFIRPPSSESPTSYTDNGQRMWTESSTSTPYIISLIVTGVFLFVAICVIVLIVCVKRPSCRKLTREIALLKNGIKFVDLEHKTMSDKDIFPDSSVEREFLLNLQFPLQESTLESETLMKEPVYSEESTLESETLRKEPVYSEESTIKLKTLMKDPDSSQVSTGNLKTLWKEPDSSEVSTGKLKTLSKEPDSSEVSTDNLKTLWKEPDSSEVSTDNLKTLWKEPDSSEGHIQPSLEDNHLYSRGHIQPSLEDNHLYSREHIKPSLEDNHLYSRGYIQAILNDNHLYSRECAYKLKTIRNDPYFSEGLIQQCSFNFDDYMHSIVSTGKLKPLRIDPDWSQVYIQQNIVNSDNYMQSIEHSVSTGKSNTLRKYPDSSLEDELSRHVEHNIRPSINCCDI